MTSLSSRAEAYGSSSMSLAAQAALYADMFTLKCETDGILVIGLQDGEALWTPVRLFCSLITVSVASIWLSRRKSIKKLLMFFSHWLRYETWHFIDDDCIQLVASFRYRRPTGGLLYELIIMVQEAMISVCWVGAHLEGLVKALKFLELASSNMLAITNLAICINLALIVNSHRTLSRIKSMSTPAPVLLCLVISVVAAAASVPFWSITVVSGTAFWVTNADKAKADWIVISVTFIDLVIGTCMLVVVSWLMAFQMRAIKECWKIHARIRYYFVLTVIGTAVNLALGMSGLIYVFRANASENILFVSWGLRFVHVALDTFVLYGALGTRHIHEGGDTLPSASVTSGTNSDRAAASSDLPRPSHHSSMKKHSGFCTPRSPVGGGAVFSTQGSRRVLPSVQSE